MTLIVPVVAPVLVFSVMVSFALVVPTTFVVLPASVTLSTAVVIFPISGVTISGVLILVGTILVTVTVDLPESILGLSSVVFRFRDRVSVQEIILASFKCVCPRMTDWTM